jgi:Skp family chaperone for outer membrane proteins
MFQPDISRAMKYSIPLIALLGFTLAGCNPFSGSKGGVALLDLDAAAKRLGRDVAIVQELKDAGDPLGNQLAAAQKQYQADFEKFKESIGNKPSDADSQKLAELGNKLNLQLQQKQQQAQQELNAKRVALVNRFREEIKPVALKIASGKGLGAVLLKSDVVVLCEESGLDITDEVVAELIRTGGGSAPAPAVSAKP